MKNILIFSLYLTSLFSEDFQDNSLDLLSLDFPQEQVSITPEPSEKLAQEKIESFFEIDDVNADLFLPEESQNAPADRNIVKEEDFLDLTSLPPPSNDSGIIIDSQETSAIADLEPESVMTEKTTSGITIDFGKVFAGSPTIYSFLFLLSMSSFFIWLYTILSLRTSQILPKNTLKILREKLASKQFPEALDICETNNSLLFKMLASGLSTRSQGTTNMMDAVRLEGKRASGAHWQKIGLLNDIAIIAPMLGLLGTVLGMFYAFYDVNRSMESISAFFDGLGISVGTTVCGLLVAILAMLFHSMTKYKLVKQLSLIENEAKTLTNLIDAGP